jgi:2',3'-cyclic-nucleotide 2'-phosphodiesterase (5'-nucleotidase family)
MPPRGGPRAAPELAPRTVRLLLVNDVYVTDTLRDGRGGLARVAFLRDSIERVTGQPVLFMLAGDVLSPSVLGKWYGGAQMVDGFNAARLDYAVLGNHEFDGSRANLVSRVSESKFRWLRATAARWAVHRFGVRGWDTVRVNGVKVVSSGRPWPCPTTLPSAAATWMRRPQRLWIRSRRMARRWWWR